MENSKIIIYDDSCPMCSAYTKAFVKTGMIRAENRLNFTSIDSVTKTLVDLNRCVDEIPVIDTNSGKVYYGIDAITLILEGRFPGIRKLANRPFIHSLLKKLYKFISYNRRVIVATHSPAGNFDCTPHFHLAYRIAFMLVFLLFNSVMLFPIHANILVHSLSTVSATELQVAHLVLVACNIAIACKMKLQPAIEYLGQVNMVALTTVLATIPLILINKTGLVPHEGVNNLYLFLLIFFVLKEYKRRMEYAGVFPQQRWVYTLNILGILTFIIFLLQFSG